MPLMPALRVLATMFHWPASARAPPVIDSANPITTPQASAYLPEPPLIALKVYAVAGTAEGQLDGAAGAVLPYLTLKPSKSLSGTEGVDTWMLFWIITPPSLLTRPGAF